MHVSLRQANRERERERRKGWFLPVLVPCVIAKGLPRPAGEAVLVLKVDVREVEVVHTAETGTSRVEVGGVGSVRRGVAASGPVC